MVLESIGKWILRGFSFSCSAALIYTFTQRDFSRIHIKELFEFAIYIVIPLLFFLIVSWVLSRTRKGSKFFFALLLFFFILPFYIVEFYIQYSASSWEKHVRAAAKRFGYDYDSRSPGEVVLNLRQRGEKAYPYFSLWKQYRALMPLATIPGKTIVYGNEIGQYMIFRSDRHGFKNPDRLWDLPSVELVFLGDSFTLGAHMPDNMGLVDWIRKKYPLILNLGVGGSGPLEQLAILKEYAVPMKPRKVVWIYDAHNDLNDMMARENHPLLRRYISEEFSQNLFYNANKIGQEMGDFFDKNVSLDSSFGRFPSFQVEWGSLIKLYHLRLALGMVIDLNPTIKFDLYEDILKRAKAIAVKKGSGFEFVYIPTYRQLSRVSEERNKILSLVRELQIPIYDLTIPFQQYSDRELLYGWARFGGAHLSPVGYKLVAQFLLQQAAFVNRDTLSIK